MQRVFSKVCTRPALARERSEVEKEKKKVPNKDSKLSLVGKCWYVCNDNRIYIYILYYIVY